MEEIASFEERLTSMKQKGEDLVASCTDQVQAKMSQQVQGHQQGTTDSYSAICSTAHRVSNTGVTQRCSEMGFVTEEGKMIFVRQVYQSLDRELQKHVSHQDTLQQCQTWLSTVREELQLNDQGPSGLQEALKQVKDFSSSP